MRIRICIVVMALAAFFDAVPSQSAAQEPACGVPVRGADGWRIEDQAAAGLDSRILCALIGKLDSLDANIHSVLVVRHGALVFEHYRAGHDERWGTDLGRVMHGPDVKHDVRSVSKSVVSLLIGIALERKLIASIDEPVFAYFPERAKLRTPAKDRILLRHLLSMSCGLAWDEDIPYSDPQNSESVMIRAADPYRYVLERPVARDPGQTWNYNGGATQLLGGVIQRVSKKWLTDFSREMLFEPLGITDFEWLRMPVSGEVAAESGLRLRPRDMAKLGQLMLAQGVWNGKTIVPAQWIEDSIKPRFATATMHYGYQWWIGAWPLGNEKFDWFEAYGLGDQRIMVVPALDLVVIFTAGQYQVEDAWRVTDGIFNDFILPAVSRP